MGCCDLATQHSYIFRDWTLTIKPKIIAYFGSFSDIPTDFPVVICWPEVTRAREYSRGECRLFLCCTNITTARPHFRSCLAPQWLLYLIKDTQLHVFTKDLLKFLEENWFLPFTDMT